MTLFYLLLIGSITFAKYFKYQRIPVASWNVNIDGIFFLYFFLKQEGWGKNFTYVELWI